MKDKDEMRSSAAEYLTFVAATGDSSDSVEMRYEDENIWLTQKMLAELYDVEVSTINEHIKKIFKDSELEESSTIRKFRIVQIEGSRQVTRDVNHYNLQMIIAIGFKVNNQRAVRFRVWANNIVESYTIKGWAMDKEKLQNKLHYAVHKHTAAELIVERADATKNNMGLTTWRNAPEGKIIKSDVSVAKNYLTEEEMTSLQLIVSAYLDLAENRARRRIPMSMEDWAKRIDIYLQADDLDVLKDAGKITTQIAKEHAETEFEKYRIIQDNIFVSDYDKYLLELEAEIK